MREVSCLILRTEISQENCERLISLLAHCLTHYETIVHMCAPIKLLGSQPVGRDPTRGRGRLLN